jgi:NADH:ubiquinone oxidoreductase subunit 6 (subunit J)
MTVNAFAFYAVAALIVLAAAAAVGLTSLRLAGYAGGATVVLMAVLELISGAYALAAVQVVVPGIAVAVVVLVLRHDEYRGLGATTTAKARWWLGGPVAVGIAAMLIVTLAVVGPGAWSRISPSTGVLLPLVRQPGAALVTVLHYRALYALAIAAALVVITVAAALTIGRRSGDEHALDRHTQLRREREERARRRRDDREQGRRRSREGS